MYQLCDLSMCKKKMSFIISSLPIVLQAYINVNTNTDNYTNSYIITDIN